MSGLASTRVSRLSRATPINPRPQLSPPAARHREQRGADKKECAYQSRHRSVVSLASRNMSRKRQVPNPFTGEMVDATYV